MYAFSCTARVLGVCLRLHAILGILPEALRALEQLKAYTKKAMGSMIPDDKALRASGCMYLIAF